MVTIFSIFGGYFYITNYLVLIFFWMRKVFPPLLFILLVWFSSCFKETISTDPSIKLSFSADTVLFDTVFTTIGSATRYFKVYNTSNSNVSISSVRLAGGDTSPYRINVDGEATSHAREVFLGANDSLFIFIEVTVDPNNNNSPLLIPDSITFETNGNYQDVKLIAWGQDVHLMRDSVISQSTTFLADKPYLIYNYLYVEPNVELTIEPGAVLHFHNRAYLIVGGTLTVNGLPDKPVVFEGDRLESFYRDKAGQWGGMWLTAGSHSSIINWAEIKNAINGIIVDTVGLPGTTTLKLHNSRIENMSSIGLWARGAVVEAGNCLFANTADYTIALTWGGEYRFYHCTIANFWGQYITRKNPALLLWNYYIDIDGNLQPRDIEEAHFANCIIYGSRSEEIVIDNTYQGQPVNAKMNFLFENTILRVGTGFDISDHTRFKNLITENPKFKDPFKSNFELDTLSPAKDMGLVSIATLFPFDLKNFSRLSDSGPDLGAFEREE
jgi:hypothetical protein